MKKRKKYKKKIKLKMPFYILIVTITSLLIMTNLKTFNFIKINYIKKIEYENNQFKVYLKENSNYSCVFTSNDEIPKIDDKNWVKSNDNICVIDYTDNYNQIYIKNDKKILYDNFHLLYFQVNSNDIYIPYNEEYKLPITYVGNINEINIEYDSEYIELNNLIIKPIKSGTSTIKINALNEEYIISITTSKYYVKATKLTGKSYLPCDEVSNEENILLDKILEGKINEAGYKTRAGVVEAARFLTLHFPYKINYFYENGRLGTNGIDGEGRYYHKGLYLSNSKFDDLSKSSNSPKTWGCKLYSSPIKKKDANGLDCSGFVSWALLNGGFDSGDIGAGFTSTKNLTDLGELKKVTTSLIKSNEIKAGDLVHNYEATGHIGIIVGIDEDNYYIAQAIWYDDDGVTVTKVSKSNMPKKFPHVVLMDKYYKNDGNYTELW